MPGGMPVRSSRSNWAGGYAVLRVAHALEMQALWDGAAAMACWASSPADVRPADAALVVRWGACWVLQPDDVYRAQVDARSAMSWVASRPCLPSWCSHEWISRCRWCSIARRTPWHEATGRGEKRRSSILSECHHLRPSMRIMCHQRLLHRRDRVVRHGARRVPLFRRVNATILPQSLPMGPLSARNGQHECSQRVSHHPSSIGVLWRPPPASRRRAGGVGWNAGGTAAVADTLGSPPWPRQCGKSSQRARLSPPGLAPQAWRLPARQIVASFSPA